MKLIPLLLFLFSTLSCTPTAKVLAGRAQPLPIEELTDGEVSVANGPAAVPLETVAFTLVQESLDATGIVAPDIERSVPVLSLAGGRVVEVKARLGDEVHQGDVLLTISSPDVSSGLGDYRKALADQIVSKRQLERVRILLEHGAAAQKDLEAAIDTANKADVDVGTAKERLRILGASPDQISSLIEIRAPRAGTLVEQNITSGSVAKSTDNSPNLFTVADLSSVWLLCDVYENDLARIRVGDLAEVRMNAWPETLRRGRVRNISRILDPGTRSAKVRLELENRNGLLRPNMFASVRFLTGPPRRRAVVGASAVFHLNDKSWVFVARQGAQFHRQDVQIGRQLADGRLEITTGLQPGDTIAANALQLASTLDTGR